MSLNDDCVRHPRMISQSSRYGDIFSSDPIRLERLINPPLAGMHRCDATHLLYIPILKTIHIGTASLNNGLSNSVSVEVEGKVANSEVS